MFSSRNWPKFFPIFFIFIVFTLTLALSDASSCCCRPCCQCCCTAVFIKVPCSCPRSCCCPPPKPCCCGCAPSPVHCVARRCCPSPVDHPPPILAPPQLILSSDLGQLGDHQQRQQVQPIIYVIGGAPLVSSSANETDGAEAEEGGGSTTKSPEGNATTVTTPRGTTTTEAELPGNTTTAATATKLPGNLTLADFPVPKLRLSINPKKKRKLGKQWDEEEEEEEEEEKALEEYEEEQSSRRGKSPKRRAKTAKLLAVSMEGLFQRRHRMLREMIKRRRQMSSPRTKRVSSLHGSRVCNNNRMSRIMGHALAEDGGGLSLSIAKRLVKRALEFAFADTKFDVICCASSSDASASSSASDSFSYSIYGRRYCEVAKKGLTCVAFD